MDRFTFHKEYYEVIQRLKKPQDRALLSLALVEFIFEEKQPENLSEVAEMAFYLLSAKISKSKNNSGRGGRPKKQNGFETVLENENRIETELKPNVETVLENENRFETKRETDPTKKERTKEKNITLEREKAPLFIPPTGDKKTDADLFFEKYPRYAKDRAKMRQDVDYKRLTEEFEKSAYLRSLYTVKQINENYCLIITGDFRDKEKKDPQADKFAGINAKAARERWYAARANAAQNKADKIRDKFMQLEEFSTIERRLSKIELEAAKETIKAEQGDTKAVKQLVKLEQEKNRLIMQRRNIIEFNGKTEEDLLPQWHCKKCSDTGYLPDGKMCDCYNKEKE